MTTPGPDPESWCSIASAWSGEPMPGTAPQADIWVVVEQQEGWGAAPLARADHGVRVLMARPLRGQERPPQAWIAWAGAQGGACPPRLRRSPLPHSSVVGGWDLADIAAGAFDDWGEPVADPLVLLCANGRRDRCCGHLGGRLAHALSAHPEAASFLTSTHLGGHRFAPTALVLPWGALHGRLDLLSLLGILAAARAGWSPAASLRGYSRLSAPAQVAEVHVRRIVGYDGVLPLHTEVERDGDRAMAVVTAPEGPRVEVRLRLEVADVLPSCGKHVEPTSRWVVTS